VRGIQESAKLNVFLALADLATQVLLVILGAVLILSPDILLSNVHWGEAPSLNDFLVSIPIGMVAYTGIETISNMAEEAREPGRDVPRAIGLVALAVFGIYAFLPAVALSAMPVHSVPAENPITGSTFTSQLATTYAADPVAGIVQNLGLGALTTPMALYVGILAGTILIIATNAGLIGVSRLTYSMGVHRQMPDVIRTVHPVYRTPWLAIVIFTGAALVMMAVAAQTDSGVAFLGSLYAFGAMLSFTVAHVSVIVLRFRKPDPGQPFRAPFNITIAGRDVPLFAVFGGLGTGAAFVVTCALFPAVRWAGIGWLAVGMVVYVVYRRRSGLSLTHTVTAEARASGPAIELEYRTVVLHVTDDAVTDEMTVTALRLASESNATVVALYPLVVPPDRALNDVRPEERDRAYRQLGEAEALGVEYGVNVIGRFRPTRHAGRELVREARTRGSEVIVLASPGRSLRSGRIFGSTVDYVFRHSACKVMVGATPDVRGPHRPVRAKVPTT
jgi:APA family basic amino acid/polyamine antiporter